MNFLPLVSKTFKEGNGMEVPSTCHLTTCKHTATLGFLISTGDHPQISGIILGADSKSHSMWCNVVIL